MLPRLTPVPGGAASGKPPFAEWLVTVSNEVGFSVWPDHVPARQFQAAQGALNQRLAAESVLAAGISQVLKGHLP